jgi:hypothetical protein
MSIYKTSVYGISVRQALEAMKKMPDVFVPTGSRVYGGAEECSDYDFVVNPKVTWWRGQVMEGLIQSWAHPGELREETTLVCASEAYEPDLDISRSPGDWPVGDGCPMVYLIGHEYHQINLVFPETEKAFKAWCEATQILASLKGEDTVRIKVKAARVLAFRVLRRQIEKGLM